ncbi:MAG: FAD:protein FMN transferase [Pirellulaceae bacterium]
MAKGHGVDRIVSLLQSLGCANVFVNIGGEIRATGDKGTAGPWRAGVERPDEQISILLFPVALHDQAIATSGDYRNFFEVEGKRYSHTIDPRTGRPVTHQLASVSVVADNCMIADGWATALNVLGRGKAHGWRSYFDWMPTCWNAWRIDISRSLLVALSNGANRNNLLLYELYQ